METYTVRLSGGKTITAQVPDGASDKQVRSAFAQQMKRYGIDVGKQAVERPIPQEWRNAMMGEIKPAEPTYAEKAQGVIASILAKLGVDERYAAHFGKRLGSALTDLTPAGNVTDFLDADSDFERQLAILPLPGPIKKELKAGIRAWHGSPHDFDRFDLSKIGTGEGAQAYGHGLYFAENPETARAYQDTLAGKWEVAGSDADEIISRHLNQANGDTKWAAKSLLSEAVSKPVGVERDRLLAALDALESMPTGAVKRKVGGRLYEVNINAKPEDFLDWDAPLGRQAPHIQGAFNDLVDPHFSARRASQIADGSLTGAGVYNAPMGIDQVGWNHATEAWRDAGVPGLKYLDQGSRGAGNGTRNYVVFDDSLINILAKY